MRDKRKTKSQRQGVKPVRKRIVRLKAAGKGSKASKPEQRACGKAHTKRKQEESAAASATLQALFENTPYGLVITNPKRIILHCNPAFASMLGYSREELIGKKAADITYGEDEPENVRLFHEALEKRCSGFWMEKRYVRKDGTILWADLTISCLYDGTGNADLIVAMVQDITEQKLVEEALIIAQKRAKDEHARSDALFSAIGNSISIQDPQFKIIFQNQTAKDSIGDHIGEFCYAAYEHRDHVCDECPVAMAFSDGNIHIIERNLPVCREERIPAEVTASPLRDADGNIVAVIETFRDISRRRQTEDILKLLKAAIESLPVGITIADLNGKIIYTNPADAELHGYTESELIGRDARLFAPPETWDPVAFEQLHAMGIRKRESTNIRKNGEIFPVQLISRAVKNAEGVPIGIITACEDVTERKQAEEKLRNAQNMEVIGKLASGVAHEVRNPLNAIMAISDALAKDLGENSEQRPFLEHIRSQVDRLAMLMKDMLDLGKPVEQFQFQRESLNDICSAAVDIWRHSGLGSPRELTITQPSGGAQIFVNADSHRLQQVFINLFENAIQHSPEGSAIEVLIHKPAGKICAVHVVDRGSGVAPEYLQRVFEPFFSTRRGGTGLGMSIVKHIVETHGGTIEIVNNDPPPGCTVIVRLPESQEEQV